MPIGSPRLILLSVGAVGVSISGGSAVAGSLWTDVDHVSQRPETSARFDDARFWSRVAAERSRRGAYGAALDATRRQVSLGDMDSAVLGNGADLLMALGRLDEAIEQYREALIVEQREREGNRSGRGDLQNRGLIAFGLAAALDRNGEAVAAREAIRRALAVDDTMAVLRRVRQGDGELFLVPPHDVFFYLGLGHEEKGRSDDAVAAFRSYLAGPRSSGIGAATPGRYAQRARDHLARLLGDGSGQRPSSQPTRALRIVHEATVGAEGPLVAPLIDAAWRAHPRLLDACLSQGAIDGGDPGSSGAGARGVRLRLEVTLDEDGVARAVTVDAPPGFAPAFEVCVEEAIRARFTTSKPARKKPTRAHIELLLAPVEPNGL